MDRIKHIPPDVQQRIVYNMLLLREDIRPCVTALVGCRDLIRLHRNTLDEARFEQLLQHVFSAIDKLEWCFEEYIKNPDSTRPLF